MTTYWAVPAGVLDALGGLVDGDAPVAWSMKDPEDGSTIITVSAAVEGADFYIAANGWLLLPQSAPALAELVARHATGDEHKREVVIGLSVFANGPTVMLSAPGSMFSWSLAESTRNSAHALAVLVCFLANHATGSGRFAPREVTL